MRRPDSNAAPGCGLETGVTVTREQEDKRWDALPQQ